MFSNQDLPSPFLNPKTSSPVFLCHWMFPVDILQVAKVMISKMHFHFLINIEVVWEQYDSCKWTLKRLLLVANPMIKIRTDDNCGTILCCVLVLSRTKRTFYYGKNNIIFKSQYPVLLIWTKDHSWCKFIDVNWSMWNIAEVYFCIFNHTRQSINNHASQGSSARGMVLTKGFNYHFCSVWIHMAPW